MRSLSECSSDEGARMARKERYTVQFEDGTMRSVVAQSYKGAKAVFMVRYQPPAGTSIRIWKQSDPSVKKNMRIPGNRAVWRDPRRSR